MAKVISVMNHKGGVGKTTCTANIAHALALKYHKKVFVLDVDFQCNCSDIMIDQVDPTPSLCEVLGGDLSPTQALYPTQFSENVFCIPANSDLVKFEQIIPKMGKPDSFFAMRDALREYIDDNYDFCLIDCPPSHGIFVMNALCMSDFVIVPTQSGSRNSIKGLTAALGLIEMINDEYNEDLGFMRVLLNMRDLRTTLDKSFEKHVRAMFPGNVFDTAIPINVSVKKAENSGQTVFQKFPASKGAKAFTLLAKEIIDLSNV